MHTSTQINTFLLGSGLCPHSSDKYDHKPKKEKKKQMILFLLKTQAKTLSVCLQQYDFRKKQTHLKHNDLEFTSCLHTGLCHCSVWLFSHARQPSRASHGKCQGILSHTKYTLQDCLSNDAITFQMSKFNQKASLEILTFTGCASKKTSSYWHM